MTRKTPSFARNWQQILSAEIERESGITMRWIDAVLEDTKLVLKGECANVGWATDGGHTTCEMRKGFVDFVQRIGQNTMEPHTVKTFALHPNPHIYVSIEGQKIEHEIYQQRFETYVAQLILENNAAWDEIATTTAQSSTSYQAFKLADAKKIREMAKQARGRVGPGGSGYKAALESLETQFRNHIKRAGADGKNIPPRLLQSATDNLRVAQSAKIGEKLAPNPIPSAGKAMVESVEGEAASLSKAGWIGATAYTGILLYQVMLAHEDAEKADEYEAALTKNLSVLTAGTIAGEVSAAAITRSPYFNNPYVAIAIGVITGIISTGLAEKIYDALFTEGDATDEGP